MVVIRLARGGAKKRPFFNIVATDSRNPRDGRFIERVGFYNPVAAGAETKFRVAPDRLNYWTGVGARMSPTVARLVKQHGSAQMQAPGGAASTDSVKGSDTAGTVEGAAQPAVAGEPAA